LFSLDAVPASIRPRPTPIGARAPSFPTLSEPPWPSGEVNEVETERARLKSGSFKPTTARPDVDDSTRPIERVRTAAPSGSQPRPLVRTLSLRASMYAHPRALALAASLLAVLSLVWIASNSLAPGAVIVRSNDDADGRAPITAFTTMPAGANVKASEARDASSPALNTGRLSINTRPWSTVYLGKRVLGTTPLADVPVPRSALTLKMVDRDGHVHVRRVPASKQPARSVHFAF